MSSTERVRTRAQRVASRIDYNGFSKRFKKLVLDDNGLMKLGLVFAAAVLVTIICGAWDPPLKFKLFSSPDRDIICNTNFSAVNAQQTSDNKTAALKLTPHYYSNDPAKLFAYKRLLTQEMQSIMGITELSRATTEERKTLRAYLPTHPTPEDEQHALEKLQSYFEEDVDLANYRSALDKVFRPFEQYGVIKNIHSPDSGNQELIKVYNVEKTRDMNAENAFPADAAAAILKGEKSGKSDSDEDVGFAVMMDRKLEAVQVRVPEVLFGNGLIVRNTLNDVFEHDHDIVEYLFDRIRHAPPETLSEDLANTKYAQAEEVNKVGEVRQFFVAGQPIVRANDRIKTNEYQWLREERSTYLKSRLALARMIRFLATLAFNALLLTSAYFIVVSKRLAHSSNNERQTVRDLAVFLGFLVFFFLIGRSLQIMWPNRGTLVELTPVVIFVELTTFAISWGVALTVGVLLSLMLTVSNGGGLEVFVPLCGTAVFVSFLARTVRTRLQLVFLAFDTSVCAFLLSLASGLLANDFMRPNVGASGYAFLMSDAAYSVYIAFYHGLWAFLGGVLTTCLLPVVELYFHVVTPMQLLEYANPSHPLLIELNQRAPATYNHSLQTSFLAEAAAEAIGARSYLVKVSAYFHDVGKMMNPEYFTENQNGYNIHDELEPRMSALVIVAHVKDGVNLGKKYKLPREIVDLIEQHHGTMLVSFFYEKARKAAQAEDPDARLDEAPFRYPGPSPQSKEAGVLMLADAVESASRSLTDWSPRRVENLVRKITDLRIEDGQFRDSGLTFGEIQTIQQSLVTSLLASRHTRVKYPDGVKGEKGDKDESRVERAEESRIVKSDASRVAKTDGSKSSVHGDDSRIVKSLGGKSDASSISDASTIIRRQY